MTNFIAFYIYQFRSGILVLFYFLITLPNQRPLAIICFALILLLTVMTIVDLHLLLFFCCFYNQFLIINYRNIAFNEMLVEDPTFFFKMSIFPDPKYYSNNIPYILKWYHYSRISTLIIALFIVFVVWINIFNCWNKNIIALVFFINEAEIDPNDIYFTWVNQIFSSIPAFYKVFLGVNIILAFNLDWLLFL